MGTKKVKCIRKRLAWLDFPYLTFKHSEKYIEIQDCVGLKSLQKAVLLSV